VRRRTINLVQKYKRTRSFRQEREDDDADIPEEAVNRDGERLADPASSIVDSEELVLRGDLLRKAYANVEDPRDLEAAILHYGHGISLKELAREMNTTERRAKYWARKGIEAMRKVLGPLSCKEKR
jgi:DNA-directed RNA polymerase specialized sigma24 family protein